MGERKVASVTPTLQLETGSLSPSYPITPRIPLAELDPASLSQRLFHSPGVVGERKPSPSSLLFTQLPISSSDQERHFGLRAERELNELRQQIELLNSLVIQNSCNIKSDPEMSQLVEELSNEKDALCHLLKEKETELDKLKEKLIDLQSEYAKDIREVKSRAHALTSEVSRQEAAYRTLELEHRKSLKCICSLTAYIESLPALEEVRELKAALEAKTAQCKDANQLVAELEQNLKELHESARKEKDDNFRLQIELREIREQNAALAGKLREAERLRYEARNLDEKDVENVLFDLAEQRLDTDRWRSLAGWKEKKFEQEKQRLEEQVRNISGLLEKANIQLRDTAAGLRESEAGRRSLESQLAVCEKEAGRLRDELDRTALEVRNLQVQDKIGQEMGIIFSRISSCMQSCLNELSLLRDLSDEIVKGRDPNLSVLLGVRDMSLLQEKSPAASYINLDVSERLKLARSQLESARTILSTIRTMRENLGEKYADNLADNMTSCVTQ